MFSYKICEIFKNTYFEERLRKTASISFTSKNTIANSGGEFGLDLDSAKFFFFLNVTILFNQMQPYNLYVS